ncbi:hypothetical protein P2Q00_50335 [Streptomyces coacervatus]|uniref:hypothetical protein n=1 Tax=Streptomyces coacervatus TaxID=647381 RepID=UPI0023DBE3FC|nr:hypothetical protein [Streptomyces coacervatus]MDF2273526.1 hypothetical protein [Streptomyces coacervatus]
MRVADGPLKPLHRTTAEALPSAGVVSLMRPQTGQQIRRPRQRGARSPVELLAIFDSLRRDPSLRLNEAGRQVLRMLDACSAVVRDRQRIIDTVPAHCREPLSQLADGYAEIWQLLADDLRRTGIGDPAMVQPSSLGA